MAEWHCTLSAKIQEMLFLWVPSSHTALGQNKPPRVADRTEHIGARWWDPMHEALPKLSLLDAQCSAITCMAAHGQCTQSMLHTWGLFRQCNLRMETEWTLSSPEVGRKNAGGTEESIVAPAFDHDCMVRCGEVAVFTGIIFTDGSTQCPTSGFLRRPSGHLLAVRSWGLRPRAVHWRIGSGNPHLDGDEAMILGVFGMNCSILPVRRSVATRVTTCCTPPQHHCAVRHRSPEPALLVSSKPNPVGQAGGSHASSIFSSFPLPNMNQFCALFLVRRVQEGRRGGAIRGGVWCTRAGQPESFVLRMSCS
eukprot:548792-Amphidinium_carterae.2